MLGSFLKKISALLLFISLSASISGAETFWTETWDEDPSVIKAYPDHWYDTSCGTDSSGKDLWPLNSNPGVSSENAYSGNKSLKHVFRGHQAIDPGSGGCFMDRYHKNTDEIWITYWEYMEPGFKIDHIGTKALKPAGHGGSHWWTYMWGQANLTFNCQACKDADEGPFGTETYYQNMTAFPMPQGKWVCYELHLKYNTPGQKNAVYEGFGTVDGKTVQFAGHYNREWRGTSTSDPLPSNSSFNFVREYVQDGWGTLYRDDLSVGDTRKGCGNAPPPPPTKSKPKAPTRVRIIN